MSRNWHPRHPARRSPGQQRGAQHGRPAGRGHAGVARQTGRQLLFPWPTHRLALPATEETPAATDAHATAGEGQPTLANPTAVTGEQ